MPIPKNILDEIITLDESVDENEADELETISSELYDLLQSHPDKFNSWEVQFIEDMIYPDKMGLTPKQREWLYRLDKKFLKG
jgi:hypothetical protein